MKYLARPIVIVMTLAMILPATGFAIPAGQTAGARAAGQDEELVYTAVAQYVGTGATGQTPVTITIDRMSTPDQRDALEEVFLTRGMQALADALRDAPEVGYIDTPSAALSWDLHYARVFDGAHGNRIIRLATDRPVSFREAVQGRSNWTWDYTVSLIELVVDEQGNGHGVLYTGVEFAYDESNDTLTVKSISNRPVRLNNVQRRYTDR